MDKSLFQHSITETVRFHEVDILGVCNNAVYFNYFEDARIKYVQDLKRNFQLKELLEGNSFFIMVHNNCDYLEPAFLDDELRIHTRISFIKNTSFGFEHLVEKISTGRIIAKGGGAVVHIDKVIRQPLPIPDEFYEAVKSFEKGVDILRS
ncbi:MAG TPA: thioesterase family protein [Melioribacteraceae bacterium]|nr:thioesterase family protein [Melioribacteraceae bacterium]